MTLTFTDSKTGKVYGSFTAAGCNGLFTRKQKMQIASLRIKLLSGAMAESGAAEVDVQIIMDCEGSRTAERLLAIPARFSDPAYLRAERKVARVERSIRRAVR